MTIHPPLPRMIQVENTSRCNLKCKMCPLTNGVSTTADASLDIPDHAWQGVLDIAQQVQIVSLCGFGETLLDKKALNRLRQLDALGVISGITTNATSMTADIAKALNTISLLQSVHVSIDSPDANVYKDIRGGKLSKTLKGLEHLAKHFTRAIAVCSVVTPQTLPTLKAFPPLLARLGIRHYVLQRLNTSRDELWAMRLSSPTSHHAELLNLKQLAQANGISLEIDSVLECEIAGIPFANFDYEARPDPTHTRMCSAPWGGAFIDARGKVYPCCNSTTDAVVGDITANSFAEIWQGEQFNKFRKDLTSGLTTPRSCQGCTLVPVGRHPLLT